MTGRITKLEPTGNRLPEIGKVKCGEKTEKACRSFDYFIGFGKYKSYFDNVYNNPDKIQILFYTDNISECCNERFELRDKAGKLFGKGDGQNFEIWDGKQYAPFTTAEFPDLLVRTAVKAQSPKGWERVLTLRFIIPKITGIYGAWSLETKADKSSIDQIIGVFDEVLSRAGTVTKMVFDLTVKKHVSQKPGDKSSYPVINLIPNVTEGNLAIVKAFIAENPDVTMITDEVLSRALLTQGEEEEEKTPDCFNY